LGAKLKTVTLGCKVNQYETQFVREGLHRIGYEDADTDTPADLCIVNTCTITGEGDSKSRQTIRRMNRDNPDARLVVMGCYATREPDAVAQLPGVSEVVTDKRELPDLLARFGVVDIPNGITGLTGRHRAYVKVQDGCLLKCSYCIIPTVRPDMFSRPLEDVLAEVQQLAEWTRLSHLVRAICNRVPQIRVRLSSIEATEVTRELIDVMKNYGDRVCPHLHVCIQSGSDRILRLMKRRWTRKHMIDRCLHVANQLDQPAFTTDLIVGFPGETDADFEDSLDVCRQIGFSKIHMFPFSARRGTPAATMPDQIDKAIKSERGQAVRELEQQLRRQYFDRLVGQRLQLLVENVDEHNVARGTSCRYAPVEATGRAFVENELVDVTVTKSTDDRVIAIAD
jgi:threonylcarbamoyladenosine tRNA methylthiotransferase MtaB